MKVKDYQVIGRQTNTELRKAVVHRLANGWSLFKRPFHDAEYFFQALVLKEKDESDTELAQILHEFAGRLANINSKLPMEIALDEVARVVCELLELADELDPQVSEDLALHADFIDKIVGEANGTLPEVPE